MGYRIVALVTLLALAAAATGHAQFRADGGTPFDQALRAYDGGELESPDAIDDSFDRPSATAASSRDGAPASSRVSSAVLDKASATGLLSVALDNSLISADGDQTITINMNLFALLAAEDPSILADNDRYAAHSGLRRVSASLTLGAAGEEESTSNATAEADTSMASGERLPSLFDVVTVRASWRLFGSRDRRDYFSDYKTALAESRSMLSEVQRSFFMLPGLAAELATAPGQEAQYRVLLAFMRANPAETDAILSAYRAGVENDLEAVNDRIDRSFLLTLAGIGEFRHEALGADKLDLQLIGEGVIGNDVDLTANLVYRWEEEVADRHDRELKIAAGVSKKVLSGSVLASDGFDTSVAVAGQFLNNERDDIFSINAGLSFPLGNGLNIPISMTWANRAEDVDEGYVRGNFGLSYDLSALERKKSD